MNKFKILIIGICLIVFNEILFAQKFSIKKDNSKIIGVNGHPFTQKDYIDFGIINQLNLLKKLHFNSYRIDINLKEGFFAQKQDSITILLEKSNELGISILPCFFTSNLYDITKNESENYSIGENAAKLFLKFFNSVNAVEVGNENDSRLNKLLYNNSTNSLVASEDLNYKKFISEASVMKGFINYLHNNKPTIKTIVDYCFTNSWYLKAVSLYGVKFDIIGNHFYTNLSMYDNRTNIAITYSDLYSYFNDSKEIYITEFNYIRAGLGASFNDVFKQFNRIVGEVKNDRMISALYFYEFLDEPSLKTKNLNSLKMEQSFGILKYFK